MYTVEHSFEVGVAPDQVFAWLTDLENLPRFQGGVFNSEVLTPPPTRVGTRYRETFKLMGFVRMVAECEVIEMKPPRVFGFSANGRQMDYQSRFTLEPAPGGTRIAHKATVTMHGIWKLLGPMVKAEGDRETMAEHQRLKAAIESDFGVNRTPAVASAQSGRSGTAEILSPPPRLHLGGNK